MAQWLVIYTWDCDMTFDMTFIGGQSTKVSVTYYNHYGIYLKEAHQVILLNPLQTKFGGGDI